MNHSINIVLFIRSSIQLSHCDSHYWSTQLNTLSMSTSMIQSYITFVAKIQSTPTSKSYFCIAHSFSVMNYRNRIDSKSQPNTFSSVFNSFHSILIINITDSIYIEYTLLNGLKSNVLPSFLSSIVYQSISMVCNLRTFNSYSFNRSLFINRNHSNSILYMNCMQSVIMPMNH